MEESTCTPELVQVVNSLIARHLVSCPPVFKLVDSVLTLQSKLVPFLHQAEQFESWLNGLEAGRMVYKQPEYESMPNYLQKHALTSKAVLQVRLSNQHHCKLNTKFYSRWR